ncbi:head-tail connector [Methylophilales phage MEP301]|nr:head-tail connector [Methylophilales phage MEP301]
MVAMMRLTAEDVLNRHEKALIRKEDFRNLYEEAYEFALPQRNLYDGHYDGKVGGSKKMNRVFDSTAISSTQRFANRMQSGIFPPQRKWCRLEPGPDIPDDRNADAQAALDVYNERLFAALKQSNFDIAIGEFLLDLSVGTAVMMVQPGDDVNPINFIPVPQYLVSIEEGANGQVDNVYRRMRIKGEAIQRQWPEAKIPSELQKKIDQKPTDEVELIEATVLDQKRGDYCYHIIHKESKTELLYKRMEYSPWVVSRYAKVAGEIYGRGPLITAMPDIKTLNKTLELLLKNASLAISGVYTAADDGVLNPNTVKIMPGAIIPVARNGGPQGESLKALPRAGDFNVSQIVINDLRMNIKRTLLDESLPPDNMSARSATEVVERMKELSQNLGSAFGRLINETMIPLVSKMLQVMDQRGIIDLPLKVNGLEIKISPVAPLAMAQNMDEVQNILQYAQIAQQAGPQGQMAIKVDVMLDHIAEKLGIPQKLRPTPQERMMMQQQMAQQAQQMAQQNPEMATQVAEAAIKKQG